MTNFWRRRSTSPRKPASKSTLLRSIWRCCRIALRAKDYYGMLLASGISILLGTQVILNVAVISASFFPTGVVLPFITLGGNATLIFLSLMGILFNISKNPAE